MTLVHSIDPDDTPALRKERGAFFTPDEITRFVANWAIRTSRDRVLEPSAGDAAFLVAAVDRLRTLAPVGNSRPAVDGVEIHAHSARVADKRVRDAGGKARILHSDFFAVEPNPTYHAVIGNPPYIRYQDFSGEARARSREAALRGGVSLTGLASSWAAFTVHSAMFLQRGGRLGLVLPAELLSVNYAAPVRRFLFSRFREVELVLFDEQVFPEAEADVVLLLADGYLEGPAEHATIRQSKNAADLVSLGAGQIWRPTDPAAKWTSSLIDPKAIEPMHELLQRDMFTRLELWGDTTLGIVTGNNKYFTLSPQRVKELGLRRNELLRLSPPGSSHLRGLELSSAMLTKLGREGHATYLFYPSDPPSPEAAAYIEDGHRTGVDTAYKCRVRRTWYQVPLVPAADLLLTCMNADTPRLTANEAGARHLNSVHGVYLAEQHRTLGRELLPLASLNSVTLLHAEIVGRAYGGGILKIEPKEADLWAMPSAALIACRADALRAIKGAVADLLTEGKLLDAVEMVDKIILQGHGEITTKQVKHIRQARAELAHRRTMRAASGR
ncbi:methyltransferase [Burkholderia pseudomallei]|uniref:Eco57I restriction-modification methylase domain-containing protein n=1 Tax=Burkholderia pseudomallei TaxID=28450 RepID=UPI0005729092|nr:N-6 DNA methylase [Burkholderia pseudomallei]AJX22152.1 eco57I restriction-modification methylase family protein [Burkholderia pseudomallei MSHR491]ONC09026.1 methyltransferase [Burkholderia pseudomallei]